MADDFTSPRDIAKLNIAHFTGLLQTALDEHTRKIIERLLAAEKDELADPPEPRADLSTPSS